MTDIQITRFEQSHVQAVAQIEQACFADPWTEDGLREELDNSCARFLTAVTADGTVAGYIGCHTVLDEGYIANVAVSPAFRRQGIGRQLVRTLLERSKDLAFVTLEVVRPMRRQSPCIRSAAFSPSVFAKSFTAIRQKMRC